MDLITDNQKTGPRIPKLKVLVVDDDALNQRMMQLLMEREGYQVDLASNGLEALEAVKIHTYDVVFMDLQMPVLDGVEASRRIREWENGGRHTFIVALTASYLPEKGQVLFEAGIDNYIAKPFEIEQIQRLLRYGFQPRNKNLSVQPSLVEPHPEKLIDFQKGILQIGGDENLYRELLGDFVEGLPRRLRLLEQLYEQKELVELARSAHNLSGIASNLGALALSACAKKLDKQSGEGYTDSLDPLIQEIQLVVGKLLEVSNRFLAERQIKIESV